MPNGQSMPRVSPSAERIADITRPRETSVEGRPATTGKHPPTRTAPRRLRADRLAAWAVRGGGMAIITSILGIFVFITAEVWPLLGRAELTPAQRIAVPGTPFEAIAGDEHRTHVAGLGRDGVLRIVRLADGVTVHHESVLPAARQNAGAARQDVRLARIETPAGSGTITASTDDGRVLLVPIRWPVTFEGDLRTVRPEVAAPVVLDMDPRGGPIGVFAARGDADGNATAIAQLSDGSLAVVRRSLRENLFTGEATESLERGTAGRMAPLTALVLDAGGRNLYGATTTGALHWWRLHGAELGAPETVPGDASPVTALSLLLGERALAVGQENGGVSVWFPVREGEGEGFDLVRVRVFEPHDGAVRLIRPSTRDRSFLTVDAHGAARLYHSTSHRTLWSGHTGIEAPTALFYTPKADAAYVAGSEGLVALTIDNPHPETTWRTLFGSVWYEGYQEPAHVWQSTGSTDDFEPKLSLTPLLAGTLKGTLYSLILAIPLAVFGAMYASQFMHPTYRGIVKPTVEIMAALPSVVLGFLAGLWLAPRLERTFSALILMLACLPLSVLLAGAVWQRLPRALRGRFAVGSEALFFVAVLAAGVWLCLETGPAFERWAFDGNFQEWLRARTGLTYDQRNAIVVGLAMGFAVIPIIFSISEDAFSSVPLTLISGSLALGATRWQTVTRIVLPTASPGIFSAVMIGFGRAVGETMIVLMATGNTPILDWSPFNGFRTLSANIAVEIPEAPQFGTLYRVLFLAALLLFMVTFVVNTAAEVVRQRLRRRYGQLV
jgi:phosphate transport system permease protein